MVCGLPEALNAKSQWKKKIGPQQIITVVDYQKLFSTINKYLAFFWAPILTFHLIAHFPTLGSTKASFYLILILIKQHAFQQIHKKTNTLITINIIFNVKLDGSPDGKRGLLDLHRDTLSSLHIKITPQKYTTFGNIEKKVFFPHFRHHLSLTLASKVAMESTT